MLAQGVLSYLQNNQYMYSESVLQFNFKSSINYNSTIDIFRQVSRPNC